MLNFPSSNLKHPEVRYMLVNVQAIDLGINLSCWMSSANMFNFERATHKFTYDVQGQFSKWRIRSNFELTNKALLMCVETGDKISAEQIAINNKRKIGGK